MSNELITDNLQPLVNRILSSPVDFKPAKIVDTAETTKPKSYIIIKTEKSNMGQATKKQTAVAPADEELKGKKKKEEKKLPGSLLEALSKYTNGMVKDPSKRGSKKQEVLSQDEYESGKDSDAGEEFFEAKESVSDGDELMSDEHVSDDADQDSQNHENTGSSEAESEIADDSDDEVSDVDQMSKNEDGGESDDEGSEDEGSEDEGSEDEGSEDEGSEDEVSENEGVTIATAALGDVDDDSEEDESYDEDAAAADEAKAALELAAEDDGESVNDEEEEEEEEETTESSESDTRPTTPEDDEKPVEVPLSEFYQFNEKTGDRGSNKSDRIVKNWLNRRNRPMGLLNHGVTCYTNAAVQAMIHIPAVQHYLDEVYAGKVANLKKSSVTEIFAETAHKMWLPGKKSYLNPKKLITALDDINCMMSPWQQEDSHEYFMSLLSRLQEDGVPRGQKLNSSIIYDIFGGLLHQVVTCNTCGNVSKTDQEFYDLSLHLSKRRYSLEKSITDFFAPETIKYDCEKCKSKQTAAIKKNSLLRSPETLVVHLKRFRFNGQSSSKVKQGVTYPMTLDLTHFNEAQDLLPVKYQLLSVVVHEGRSLSSGHYVAHCRQPDGSWANYDDEYINKMKEDAVLKDPSAYYLIYTRLTPKSVPLAASKPAPKPKRKAEDDERASKKQVLTKKRHVQTNAGNKQPKQVKNRKTKGFSPRINFKH